MTPPSRGATHPRHARIPAPDNRGRRESRVLGAPAAPCATKKHRGRSHRFAGTPGLPCAMVLTVSFVLSPVTGLGCHRHRRSCLRRLERQRRGVRTTRLRRPLECRSSAQSVCAATPPRPPHPAPTSVTTAKRPSCGTGWRKYGFDLGWRRREIFFRRGLDSPSEAGSSKNDH